VEEYPHWRLRYGVQGDREREDPIGGEEEGRLATKVGAIAEIRNQNLFGRAITAGLSGLVEKDYQRANVFLSNASFFGLPARSVVSAYRSRENLDPRYVYEAVGLAIEQRWRRRRVVEITYGYRFERTHTYDSDPFENDPRPLNVFTNLGRVTAAFLVDRRNDPVNSLRGTFSSVSFEQSAPTLGGESLYTRLLAQQYAFVPLGRVVLASRVVAGGAFGPDVPVSGSKHRFYAGGGNSVRGYAENALGPHDVIFNEPLGGTKLIVMNQEVRFPIYRWIRGVGFVDAGNVFSPELPFAWKEVKVGYGGGLRVDSPVGLLRVDFGIPGSTLSTSSRSARQISSGRWYFGIGHVF